MGWLLQKYNNVEYQNSVIALSQDITELMGLVPNKSWAARKLPFLWHPYTWQVLSTTIEGENSIDNG